jgi:hypothetical protein
MANTDSMTKRNFLTTGIFFLLFWAVSFGQNQNDKDPEMMKTSAGIYDSVDDFFKGHIRPYGEFDYLYTGGAMFKKSDGKSLDLCYRKTECWGFRANDGSVYRIFKNKAYNLILVGSYCVWADEASKVFRNKKNEVVNIGLSYKSNDVGNGLSFHLFISDGIDAEILGASNKNLRELFKDEPALLAQMEAHPINRKDIEASLSNVISWVVAFNKKHDK